MDDPINTPIILTSSGKDEVLVKFPNGAGHAFDNMQDVANFSDALRSMVESWRGSEEQKTLQGARKAIYEIVTEGMRQQIAVVNPEAAASFPDDVLFGSGFIADAIVDGDETKFRCSVELHVRSILLLVANVMSSVKQVQPAPAFTLTKDNWTRLSVILQRVHGFMGSEKIIDGVQGETEVIYKELPRWIKLTQAFGSGFDPRQAPKSKQPQVDVAELVAKLN